VLAPQSDVHPRDLEGIDLPPDLRWATAAITRPGQICLVGLPEAEDEASA
jgi:hypothetical protein